MLLVAALGSVAWATNGSAAETPPKPQAIELTLHPAAVPPRALQYALLPPYAEQMPGNAVPLYTKAFSIMHSGHQAQDEQIIQWLELPLAELPLADCHKMLGGFQGALEYLDMAAHRERCEWDPPLQEAGKNVFGILLPEVQYARFPARLLILRTRVAIAEKRYAEAVASLQTGYVVARQIAQQPFLVATLVGLALQEKMTEQLRELVAQPDAPNLYWAIAVLPDPLVTMNPALEFEAQQLYRVLPEMQPSQRRELSAAQWEAMAPQALGEIVQVRAALSGTWKLPASDVEKGVQELLQTAPQAKADLIAAGETREAVEAMSAGQAVLSDIFQLHETSQDELMRWRRLPYRQAAPGLKAAEARLANTSKSSLLNALTEKLRPMVSAIYTAEVEHSCELAMVRCVEAIRLYAAAHEGKLPASLEDIHEVPLPINPVTGRLFSYRLDGEVAVLDAELAEGRPAKQYRLRMAK